MFKAQKKKNIFNKIIAEIFPTLGGKVPRNRLHLECQLGKTRELSHAILTVKTLNI